MTNDNPEFVKCAMDAIEEGIKASEIKEECSCRLGLMSHAANHTTNS